MPGDTYIKGKLSDTESLSAFAEHLFRTLRITDYSRRESDNYINGEYFVGTAYGIKIKLSLADDSRFNEYRFWMTYWADGRLHTENAFFETIADYVARHLTVKDYQVARDPGSGQIGAPKLIYSRSADAAVSGKNQVDVRQVN